MLAIIIQDVDIIKVVINIVNFLPITSPILPIKIPAIGLRINVIENAVDDNKKLIVESVCGKNNSLRSTDI
jgi:hypothetical protein